MSTILPRWPAEPTDRLLAADGLVAQGSEEEDEEEDAEEDAEDEEEDTEDEEDGYSE